jgi:hypothetical protein
MYATGWKLKGFRTFSEPLIEGASESVMPLTALAGVNGNVALAGVKMVVGVARCETESLGPRVAYCLEGNVADMGERALLPNRNGPGDSSLSKPSPRVGWGSALSSGGGVGVRGASSTGKSEAMAAIIKKIVGTVGSAREHGEDRVDKRAIPQWGSLGASSRGNPPLIRRDPYSQSLAPKTAPRGRYQLRLLATSAAVDRQSPET